MNILEPTLTLGGEIDTNYKKVKKMKRPNKKFKPDSHMDSVISLSLNKFKPNILLSGSADMTAKLWDLAQNKCVYTYTHHKERVKSNFMQGRGCEIQHKGGVGSYDRGRR